MFFGHSKDWGVDLDAWAMLDAAWAERCKQMASTHNAGGGFWVQQERLPKPMKTREPSHTVKCRRQETLTLHCRWPGLQGSAKPRETMPEEHSGHGHPTEVYAGVHWTREATLHMLVTPSQWSQVWLPDHHRLCPPASGEGQTYTRGRTV